MLQQIREKSRGVFGWVILGAIIFVLTLFGFGAFTAFIGDEPAVAEVGGAEITRTELEQGIDRQRRQLMAQMGPDVDPDLFDDDALRERVLAGLIQRTLLLEGARDAGMAVPEGEIDRLILGMQEFQTDGRFDPDRFRALLASAGMTPPVFRQALAEDLLIDKLASGIGETTFTTTRELNQMAALMGQRRDVAWLRFSPEQFTGAVEVDEAAVREFFEMNLDRFRAPERVQVEYVTLELEALRDEVEVSEPALRTAYERELETFEDQERRRASHILLATNADRDEDQAIALAEQLRERLLAGESFAELAEAFSDDPGSATEGGDLGTAGRGAFVPEFERALFALEENEVSEPVRTGFGVHLIRLDGVERAEPPSFESRREALRERLQREGARERYVDMRRELDTLAFEAADLEEPAEELGLEIREAGPFSRDGEEGLFSDPDLVSAAFSREVLEDGYNSSAIEVADDKAVVLRVTQHLPARQQDFSEVQEEVHAELMLNEARRLAREASSAALERLEGGARTAAVSERYEIVWERVDRMERNQQSVPRQVLETAFRMPHPEPDGRSVNRVALPDGSQVLVLVTAVHPGDVAELADAEREQLQEILRANYGEQEFEAYRDALRRDLGVTLRRL